ncbi:MAG: U32 family peptidase [Clostridia bacterium]|nr:U32 family peptidase [Clostridia bacterium]
MKNLPELLAPAGTFSALEAAVEGGADAVYFGASQFNARMRAGNFDDSEVKAAIELCRAHGIKSYITMNIRLFDRELDDALTLAEKLYCYGADALILADNGLAQKIHRRLPDFELHGSTQLSGHTVSDGEALSMAGFSRMVCPREISRDELFSLCSNSPVEIEMFVHGAYCVSFSGQCLMSAVMGGRSGNRGSCAQPCRQPYEMNGKKGYPVSLKDMCLAGCMEDIIKSGVASLKLEGRQKPAEYVYGVTKTYRRLLDERRNSTEEELSYLKQLFSRQGFTDGYFNKKPQGMLGVRTMDEYIASEKTVFEGLKKKVPAKTTVEVKTGEPMRYSLSTPYNEVSITGSIAEKNEKISPMTEEGARECAARLGSTPFELSDFSCHIDGDAFVTRSMLNALRREATEALMGVGKRELPPAAAENDTPAKRKTDKITYTAEFAYPQQIPHIAREFFDEIFLPCGRRAENTTPVLPPVQFDGQKPCYPEEKGSRVMVHTVGQLLEAKKRELFPVASHRFNIFNSQTAQFAEKCGAEYGILSPELTQAQIRDIKAGEKCAVVYGRIPLMTLCRCALSDGGANCKMGGKGIAGGKENSLCRGEIKDRRGVVFPILALPDCTNIVYNSVPIYMADKEKDLIKMGITKRHFLFTTETKEECEEIIRRYMKGEAPRKNESYTRIQA